ncbi:MAG TPA: hypothetical protein ENK82_04310 [Campylobacterales bacterium]|nr:hypothetical protein [Campylobacterales bacterium]
MNQKKKLSTIAVSLLVLTMGSSSLQAKDKWGTPELKDKYRPQQAWMQKFSPTPDVIANTSIAQAIESCDEVVGKNRYCTIEVNGDETDFPLEIFRSKTKIVGTEDMEALTSNQSGIFIYIGDKTQQVILEGLNLQGHSAGDDEIYGIVVEGSKIKKIAILNNHIHHFDSNSDAHGIAVYGTGATGKNSISHVLIKGNEVHDMRTGSSESIVINGNVQRWEISENDVYDVNNIAIDAIGGEGTSPARQDKKGRILPGKLDAARFGFIENNYVENMHTSDNPAYGNTESWAAAIYVDGAHHVHIEGNEVVNAAWGYEIGAENCVVSRHITMLNNKSEDTYYGDLVLGGYASTGFKADKSINCNPNNTEDANEGHGYVKFLTIKNNSFNTSTGEQNSVTLQNRTTNAVIVQEGVEAVNETGNGSAKGDENAVRVVE